VEDLKKTMGNGTVLKTLSISDLKKNYTKEELRVMFPKVHKHLKLFKKHFGDDTKLVSFREGYIEVK